MTHENETAQAGSFKGYHLAIIMGLFFGLIFAVNLALAVLASKNWTGLVVKNSYVASQNFNVELDAAKVQKAKGWHSSFSYLDGQFILRLLDAQGMALKATALRATVGRPAYEQKDHVVRFTLLDNGSYQAQDRLEAGLWALRLEAEIDGKPYRRDVRFLVDRTGKGTVQ